MRKIDTRRIDSRKIENNLHAYKDALLEVAKGILTNGDDVSNAVWQARLNNRSLLKPLGDGRLGKQLRNDLFVLALSAKGEIHIEFLEHFGNEITAQEMLDDPRIFEQLFGPFIRKRDEKMLAWLKEWLKTSGDDLREHHTDLWSAILTTARAEGVFSLIAEPAKNPDTSS